MDVGPTYRSIILVEGFTGNADDDDDDNDDDDDYYSTGSETSMYPYTGPLSSFTWHLNEEFKNKIKNKL